MSCVCTIAVALAPYGWERDIVRQCIWRRGVSVPDELLVGLAERFPPPFVVACIDSVHTQADADLLQREVAR